MSIEITTTEYEWSTGHKPRGRGFWAFRLATNSGTIIFCWNGTYSEAKREAISRAKSMGAYRIIVGG